MLVRPLLCYGRLYLDCHGFAEGLLSFSFFISGFLFITLRVVVLLFHLEKWISKVIF